MGGFLSSIFTGNNPGLNSSLNKMQDLAGFSTNTGEKGTNAAMNYNLGLLSGNPQQTAQVMAPEIKAAGEQAQQNKNTVAQFGNRGGGMNAVMAGLDDATRSKLLALQGQLMSGAAGQLGQLGTANLGLGQQGTMDAAKLAQQQMENQQGSLLGGVINKGVQGALGMIPGLGGIF